MSEQAIEADDELEPLESLISGEEPPQAPEQRETEESPPQGEYEAPEPSQQDERDYEAEARKMGWRPKDEWNGDPNHWRDAKSFVELGETSPAILRQRVEKLDKTLEQERAEMRRYREETKRHLDGMRRAQDYALKRQRETFMQQIEAVKQQAAQDGDPDLYQHARRQEEQARKAWEQEDKQLQEAYPQAQPEQQDAAKQMPPEVSDWMGRNPWFNSDPAMTQTAIGIDQDLASRMPGLTESERLERVSQRVREIFPDRFGEQPAQQPPQANGQQRPRRQGSPVEGAQRMSGPQQNASGRFGELPSDAKQEYANAVKEGIIQDSASERKNWAEVYFNPNVDKERAAR